MDLLYGEGKVSLKKQGQAFELSYKGVINITKSDNNLFISANRNTVIGIMLDNSNLPESLFEYSGKLEIKRFTLIKDNKPSYMNFKNTGLNYWELDAENWEDDSSIWGSLSKKYPSTANKLYQRKMIAVNNNLKVTQNNQYIYKDGKEVEKGTDIHIYSDGSIMTGAMLDENSVEIFYKKERIGSIVPKISGITRTAKTAVRASSKPSASGGGY